MIKATTSLDIEKILSADGLIAGSFSGYEFRPQQLQMACAIRDSFAARRHLVAEAGTGVGKSFAYLVPAILLVHSERTKVLISTFTITLQEQLINKDVPFLVKLLPKTFTAVLAKGRGNYLCKRRLKFAMRRQGIMFDDFGSALAVIRQWAAHTVRSVIFRFFLKMTSGTPSKVNTATAEEENVPTSAIAFTGEQGGVWITPILS
jgi:ATP-dependent DNA helicase DinG